MRTPESFYKETAEIHNVPIGLVRAVNKFFWKEGIKKNLSNVNYNSIFIKNFGTIVISKYKLNKYILELIEKIRRVQRSDKYREETKQFIIDRYKKNIRILLKRRNDIIKTGYYKNGYNY